VRAHKGRGRSFGENKKPKRDDKRCDQQRHDRRYEAAGVNQFLAEAAIRGIVSAWKFAPREIGAVVGIGPGLRDSASRRSKRSAERRVDVRLDDEALDHDCEKGKQRWNAFERRTEKRDCAAFTQPRRPMPMSFARLHLRFDLSIGSEEMVRTPSMPIGEITPS